MAGANRGEEGRKARNWKTEREERDERDQPFPSLSTVQYSTVQNFINSPQGLFRANLRLKKKKTKIKLTCNIIPHVNVLS